MDIADSKPLIPSSRPLPLSVCTGPKSSEGEDRIAVGNYADLRFDGTSLSRLRLLGVSIRINRLNLLACNKTLFWFLSRDAVTKRKIMLQQIYSSGCPSVHK